MIPEKAKKPMRIVCKAAFTIFVLLLYIVGHETAHSEIARYDGCKHTDTDIKLTFEGESKCLDNKYVMSTRALGFHSINEIFGYGLLPFLVVGLGIFWRMK